MTINRLNFIKMDIFFSCIASLNATTRAFVYLFYLQENVQFVTWVTSAKFYNMKTDTILF